MPLTTYPYTGSQGACKYDVSKGITNVASYTNLPKWDPVALQNAVAQQPVGVAVAASSSDMFFYKSGIISSATCGTSVNHAVLAIGYGTDPVSGKDYWLVKNSWGTTWGDQGYFKVLKSS